MRRKDDLGMKREAQNFGQRLNWVFERGLKYHSGDEHNRVLKKSLLFVLN